MSSISSAIWSRSASEALPERSNSALRSVQLVEIQVDELGGAHDSIIVLAQCVANATGIIELMRGRHRVPASRSRRKAPSQAARNLLNVSGLHDIPEPVRPDGIVLMAQTISKGSYLVPWLLWHEEEARRFSRRKAPRLLRFTDSLQATLYSVASLLIVFESSQVHSSHIRWMACTFSMMSSDAGLVFQKAMARSLSISL